MKSRLLKFDTGIGTNMWLSYVKVALRGLLKHRLYAAINVVGLTIGLAVYMFSSLIADYERDHDNMFQNRDRIFTVASVHGANSNAGTAETRGVYTAMQPLIEHQMEGLEASARSLAVEYLLTGGRNAFYQQVRFVDPAFLKMFDFEYLYGDSTRLSGPNQIAVSDAFALKFFGRVDVVGEIVMLERSTGLSIRAVYKSVPANSHFSSVIGFDESLDAISLMQTFRVLDPKMEVDTNWRNLSDSNLLYLMTDGAVDVASLALQVNEVYRGNAPEHKFERIPGHRVRPLSEANLSYWHSMGVPFIQTVRFLGLLVLTIAIINYTNLATAQNIGRAREVGLRKTLGANHKQLLVQFLLESQSIVVMAMSLALVVVEVAMPAFNQALGKTLVVDYLTIVPWLIGLTLMVGLLAGAYPAYLIVQATPVEALKNASGTGNKGGIFRNIMICAQFVISIIMLAMVLVVFTQNEKVQSSSEIFPKSQIIDIMRIDRDMIMSRAGTLKREITAIDGVTTAAYSSQVPYQMQNWHWGVTREKGDQINALDVNTMNIGFDFLKTYDVPIVAGRAFSKGISADMSISAVRRANVVINELASRMLGFETPDQAVGQSFYDDGDDPYHFIIIGVMADRNILGLQNHLKPFVLRVQEVAYRHLSVRVNGQNLQQTIGDIEAVWSRVIPEYPIDWSFLDARFDDEFKVMKTVNQVISGFAVLAVALALFGLFGLAAFMAQRRTREIGIRKVLGADLRRIVSMLIFQFSKPVMVATFLALPLAYFATEQYLAIFADRIDRAELLLLTAAFIAVLLSWATISLHAFRVARTNPIKALRYE